MPDVPHVAAGELLTEGWPKPVERVGHFPAESGGQNPWNRVAKTCGIRNQVVARLLERGLIYRPSRGRYDFALPLFRAYLRRQGNLTQLSRGR